MILSMMMSLLQLDMMSLTLLTHTVSKHWEPAMLQTVLVIAYTTILMSMSDTQQS